MAKPGDYVVVRAVVTDDGRNVIVAPGVELPVAAVQIVADLPRQPMGAPVGLVIYFENEQERAEFAELVCDIPDVEVREIER